MRALARSIGLPHATAMVVGTIIGASIFVQPSEVSRAAPTFAGMMLVWIAAGALTWFGASVCAELSSAFPQTGGVYVFLRELFGPAAGFLWGWAMFWSMHSGIIAAIAVVFARYAATVVPAGEAGIRGISIGAIVALSAVNDAGVGLGSRLQAGLTLTKVLAIAILFHASRPAWLVVAGALAGLAQLFKGVFAADLVVVIGIPVIISLTAGRAIPSAATARAAVAIFTGWATVIAAAGLVLFEQGALGGAIAVLGRSDVSYIATYGSAGITGPGGAMLAAARILVPVIAGAGGATVHMVRRRPTAAALAWWLGWDVASSMVSGRGFPHYVQQAEPAMCLALAMAAVALLQRGADKRLLAGATVGAAAISCLLVLWIPSAELSLAQGRGLPNLKFDSVAPSGLAAYYSDGYHRLIDPSTAPTFDRLFPSNLTLQRTAAGEIDSHSAPSDRVYVWGWIPWIYTLSNRTPAGRYVALDSAYYVEPSAQTTLLRDLEAHPPAVLIIETKAAPEALLDFLWRHNYQHNVTRVNGGDFWVLQVRH